MNKTQIEWVKNPDGTQGKTWNPITGCLNGCEYCYARRLANGRLRSRYLANDNLAPTMGEGIIPINASSLLDGLDPFYPRFWPEKLLELKTKKLGRNCIRKPKGVFVCDMSDLFGIGVPEEWTRQVLNTIRNCSQYRFYLLTKQPQNLIKFSPFPPNCYVGVTACNDSMMVEAIKKLKETRAKVKYISIEPFLERINCYAIDIYLKDAGINQIIIGAQTKPYKPPEIEWVKEIVEACDKAGIPIFLKDNLNPIMGGYPIPKENMWAYEFKLGKFLLRQELPQ